MFNYSNTHKQTEFVKQEYYNVPMPANRKPLRKIHLGLAAISILLPSTNCVSSESDVRFQYTNSKAIDMDTIEETFLLEEKHTVDFIKLLCCSEIKKIGLLDYNWDGYGAIKVLPSCISNALNIVNYEKLDCTKIQDIYPNPNGTISMLWENENDESLGLEIGEKFFSYYASLDGHNYFVKNDTFTIEKYNKLSSYLSQL